jgi:TetR/AcrR family transcriptional regulator, mexCD-oprJ operon repressor
MPATAREKRADARRNIAAILDAALACLTEDADASIADIARRAGVGRITLYGHFSTRADLIDAVFTRLLDESDHALAAVDLTGDPRHALTRLIESSWQIIHRYRTLLRAAQRSLTPERIRAAHDEPMRRLHGLIQHGQDEGAFRSDLPAVWLVATFYNVIHGAADEIAAGRLADTEAATVITATLLAAYTPPGQPVPRAR